MLNGKTDTARLLRDAVVADDPARSLLERSAREGRLSRSPTFRSSGRPSSISGATRSSRRCAPKASASTGIGQGSSTSSNDPFFNIHLFLNAFGAQVVSPDGKLQIADPKTRKRVIAALDSYAKPIKNKCAPPDAVNWNGVDDNVSFLNKKNMVAMNPTLSIPMSLQAKSPDVYANDIRTTPWPDGPDGKPTPAMISVKQILAFSDSPQI